LILLIDNYDSFTYNLYQQVSGLGGSVRVILNDELTLDEIVDLAPEKLIISPGPRTPDDSGISIPLIQKFYANIPILGVCLGHQCLAMAFGERVRPAQKLLFGKTSSIIQNGSRIMTGLPSQFDVARYHSLVINEAPADILVSSVDDRGDIMSIEHKSLPLFGVQFHPESFLMLEYGNAIISNFLAIP